MSTRRRSKGPHSEREILHLVNQIYEAALDPALWGQFLESVAEVIAADSTGLVIHNYTHNQGQMAVMTRFDPSLQREYDEHYASVNLWKNRYSSRYEMGKVLNGSVLCSETEFERSEWYADYLRRADVYYSMGAVLFRDELSSGTLTVLRSKRHGPFDEEENVLQVLCPHLQRAVKIHRTLGNSAASYEALNSAPFGVILVGLNLRVLFVNDAAKELCDINDGLRVDSGRIVVSRHRESKLLDDMLSRAALAIAGQSLAGDDYLSITRPSGKAAFQVFVTPIRLRFFLDPYSPAVLMYVSDATSGPVTPSVLMKLFGFTRQEGRLAAMLAEGKELASAATELRIAYETARKHLQSILQKSGAHRQSELVRLVLGSVARVRSK